MVNRPKENRKPRVSVRRRLKTLIAIGLLFVLTLVAVASLYVLLIFSQEIKSVPSVADIGTVHPHEGTQVLYADGSVMAIFRQQNRKPITLKEMGKFLVQATIATEDSRFYEHRGVDFYGIARAVVRNVSGRDFRQGASTITQQLARNVNEYGIGREKRFRRKVAEALLAMRIEQTMEKDEILENYLNLIYYGNGAYGAEAASHAYFRKNCKDLTLGEAAFLAGIPQRPARYADNQDAAYKRRDWVLNRMVETKKITALERDDAMKERLDIHKPELAAIQVKGAHFFVNYVMQRLIKEFGEDAVYSGWRIHTTLDPVLQKNAEDLIRKGLRKPGVLANQGSLVAMEPSTGYIRAMVGGVDFQRNQFNIAVQGARQPGSTFKPIVYATAFDREVCNLDSSFTDDPNVPGINDPKWKVHNYTGTYSYGPMRVRTAIQQSVNTVAVKVAMKTGLEEIVKVAQRLGITTPVDPYVTLALGASAVHPIEMCSVYSVFANLGKRATPTGITIVKDSNGDTIKEVQPELVDVGLQPEAVKMIDEGLRGVVENGTGRMVGVVPGARGKTGTTNERLDVWFDGYNQDLVTIVWMGRENRNSKGVVSKKNAFLPMRGATGGQYCGTVWRDFMLTAGPILQKYRKPVGASAIVDSAIDLDQRPISVPNPAPAATSTVHLPDGATQENPTEPVTSSPSGGPGTDSLNAPATDARPVDPPPIVPSSRERGPDKVMPNPKAAPLADEEMVTVKICVDTQLIANKWCDTFIERRMRKKDAPKRRCTQHRNPVGVDPH